ncbi:MAG TPA: hypothetical protein VKD72_09925 [Gemmataceae bacterium]|nr:hypothetical protein [Gemmataceae bacterium]
MTFSLMLLAALAQAAPEPAAPSGMPPEQALAIIDAKGNLMITHVACSCVGMPGGEAVMPEHEARGDRDKAPARADKAPVKAKVKTVSVMVTTAELPARNVEAYTADGRAINAEKLRTLLAKERTVLVAMDGKKLDPFHLQLYKDDTIVLVPPANTLNMGGYIGGYGGYPVPVPPPTAPEELKRRPDDGRKPEDPKRPPDDGRKPG